MMNESYYYKVLSVPPSFAFRYLAVYSLDAATTLLTAYGSLSISF